MSKIKTSLIIPCLNEEQGLKKLLPKISTFINQIIVVDGGSTDNTVAVAKKYNADVIIEKRRGYGLALRTGCNAAKNDVIVTLDGDGTYPIHVIQDMYSHFKKTNADFLVACRFPLKHRNAMTVKNFFGNLLISSVTSLLYNYQVTDVCSGMIMMSKKTWKKIGKNVKDNKWFFSNEIKIEALSNKSVQYEEFWVELDERAGQTKVGNVWLIGIQILSQVIIKRLFP